MLMIPCGYFWPSHSACDQDDQIEAFNIRSRDDCMVLKFGGGIADVQRDNREISRVKRECPKIHARKVPQLSNGWS